MVERLELESSRLIHSLAAAAGFPRAFGLQQHNDAVRVFLFEVSFPSRNSGSKLFDAH
jgi:hypothetical protein